MRFGSGTAGIFCIGKSTKNVVPASGVVAKLIFPFNCSTNPLVIASPRPVPPVSRVSADCSCVNLLNKKG